MKKDEPNEEKPILDADNVSLESDEDSDEDFQYVLRELLNAYRPIIEEDLKRSESPEQLEKEARQPANCDDEIETANRIFEKFFTEEVALRLLPAEARELLGPIERWRWCVLHILCCIIFGWLVCRGPRTFRAFVYYLKRYWLCVRQVLGFAVSSPPTAEERKDFETLIQALAEAYKPYLTDQLATVEFTRGLPDEALSGKLDCFEGEEEAAAIFERLLTINVAPALLGRAAFDAHSKESFFWFCRCWCLCSIRFGCCLARARTSAEITRCLKFYRRCLRDCFRPLTCGLTDPHDCVEEQEIPSENILRGVEVRGTAAGAFCSHYTIEWRQSGIGAWQSNGVHYPGGAAQGACGVVNGTLGYLQTFPFIAPGLVEVRVCVFSTTGGAPQCCLITFQLQRNLVWIRGIEGVEAADPPGLFDPSAQLVDGSGAVRSFGTALRIFGSATVGGCEGKDIKRLTLSYHPNFVTNPLLPGFTQFWEVDYNTPLQIDSGLNRIFEDALTSSWREWHWPPALPPGFCSPFSNFLQDNYWSTQVPQPFPLVPSEPPCPAPVTWNSTPLPLINCQSGRYTLRLTVEDTGGGVKHDLQQVWFDNKEIYGKILQIFPIPPCTTINLGEFAAAGGDCAVPWPAQLRGIAYDEFIEEGNSSAPSDNFDGYQLWIKKDGGAWFPIPIPGPGASPWGPPFVGASRVGEPGTRCATASPSPGVVPPFTPGILAVLDLRRLDAVCNPGEPGLTLDRAHVDATGKEIPGECCGYIVWLRVRDKSICPSLSGGRHQIDDFFPFCICNDLKR
jgi:hypothetical protein